MAKIVIGVEVKRVVEKVVDTVVVPCGSIFEAVDLLSELQGATVYGDVIVKGWVPKQHPYFRFSEWAKDAPDKARFMFLHSRHLGWLSRADLERIDFWG